MKIVNLKHHPDGSWTFRTGDHLGVWYTNKSEEGLFFQHDTTGSTKQILGTCQFTACKTVSGMRRKLSRLFDE